MNNQTPRSQAGQPAPRGQPPTVFYRRRLPHWQPPGAILFVTYRLLGSLPLHSRRRLAEERRLLDREASRPGENPRDRALRQGQRLFELADRELDNSARDAGGRSWLKDPNVAALVQSNVKHWDGRRY